LTSSYAQAVLVASRRKFLLLDSNLLLLLLLGSLDIRLIASFKRLSSFTLSDFRLLRDLSQSFKIATSAHVLTEVSNLAKDLPPRQKQLVFPYIASRIQYLREDIVGAQELVTRQEFVPFGLTNTALAVLCESHLFLTNDGRPATHLRHRQLTVLTLEELRHLRRAR